MMRRLVTLAGILLLPSASLLADFSYDETATITGGAVASLMKVAGIFSKQAREPIHSTVSVKGNVMMRHSGNTGSIIDLDAQTITNIDFQKKTYSVMTFDEMKQMLDRMAQSMKQNDQAQMNFKVSVNNTGKTQQIAGVEAKELVLKMEMQATDNQTGQTGAMVITTDMWMAPAAPGYDEVRAFNKKMAEKINWTPGGGMFANRPDVSKGMAEVSKEAAKLDGIPVLEFVTMGGSGDPSTASSQQQQQTQPQQKPSFGGLLGGAIGVRRSKSSSDDPPPQSANGGGSAGSGTLLEMKTETSGFSSNPVDASQMSVPAAFKKVDPDLRRGR